MIGLGKSMTLIQFRSTWIIKGRISFVFGDNFEGLDPSMARAKRFDRCSRSGWATNLINGSYRWFHLDGANMSQSISPSVTLHARATLVLGLAARKWGLHILGGETAF